MNEKSDDRRILSRTVRAAQSSLVIRSSVESRFDVRCQSDWESRYKVMGIYRIAS